MSLLKRRARDYRQAGPLNTLIPIWGVIDDETFLTKAGHLLQVFAVRGRDAECLDPASRLAYGHRFEAAVKLLDHHFRIYQYLLKRPGPVVHGRQLYTVDVMMGLLYEGTPVADSWRAAVSPGTAITLQARQVARDHAQLRQMADAFVGHLDELHLRRLSADEGFMFLRRLLNTTEAGVTRHGRTTHLDYALGDAEVAEYLGILRVGQTEVQVLTLKEAPAATTPGLLAAFYALPGPFTACLEWARIPIEAQRRGIAARLAHHGKLRDGATVVEQITAANRAQQIDQHVAGECSLTLVTYGETASEVATQASALIALNDGSLVAEGHNVLNQWACVLPGNPAWNYRRMELHETTVADMSFLFTIDPGPATDRHGHPPVTTLATQQGTARRFHLDVAGVGHGLVLGAINSGKTCTLNHLVRGALDAAAPRVVIFDLVHGYRDLAAAVGGAYLDFGLSCSVAINPFAPAASPEQRHFLHAFCTVLMGEGPLSETHSRELADAIDGLYLDTTQPRRLSALMDGALPRPLEQRLAPWVEGGIYGHLFDHETDTLTDAPFQVFALGAMEQYPPLVEALLFYVLHRLQTALLARRDRSTLVVMDEAWRFMQHPALRAFARQALRTWRHLNASLLLATQAIEDFIRVTDTAMVETVLEACPTKFLLANPSMNRETYARLFHLNETEVAAVAGLRPRRQVFLKRDGEGEGKVLDVLLDPASAGLPTPVKEPVYAHA